MFRLFSYLFNVLLIMCLANLTQNIQNLALRQLVQQQLQSGSASNSIASPANIPQIITNAQGQILAIGSPQVSKSRWNIRCKNLSFWLYYFLQFLMDTRNVDGRVLCCLSWLCNLHMYCVLAWYNFILS